MRKSSLIVAAIVLMSTLFLGLTLLPDVRATTLYVGGAGPGNYSTIQAAINDANPSDTVYVYSGTYDEHLYVTKTISLVGENRDTTVINRGSTDDGILVLADWVNITGFTIVGNGGWIDHDAGIELFEVHDCHISGNNISIHAWAGVYIHSSQGNTVVDNTMWNNTVGVALLNSTDNFVSENTMFSLWMGISLDSSRRNRFGNNTLIWGGVFVEGDLLEHWNTNDVPTTNALDGRPIYYLSNCTGGIVPPDAGQVILANCSNTVVENQTISNAYVGIELGFTNATTIFNNRVTSCTREGDMGIHLHRSSNNTILNNTISNCDRGISLDSSSDNWAKHNEVRWNRLTGVHMLDSDMNTVYANYVSNSIADIYLENSNHNKVYYNTLQSSWVAIDIRDSNSNLINRNLISNNLPDGIALHSSHNNTVSGNTVYNNTDGIRLRQSRNNTIKGNLVSNNYNGIGMGDSENNTVFRNDIMDNVLQAYDDSDANDWDNGYPSGGNYWSDYNGTDNCSGPNQDICPDPDNTGDTPYVIDADSLDRYPRMSPAGDSRPRPPIVRDAQLSGENLENVTVTWFLSPDDGEGMGTVIAYVVWKGSIYDPNGAGYQIHDYVDDGIDYYVDIYAGEGTPGSYFYGVTAINAAGNGAFSRTQAAKITRSLAPGPNLVSIPLIQSDESVETVLQTVKYDNAWSYNSSSGKWNWFMKDKTYSGGLSGLNHTMGVWVNVTQDCNLTVAGIVPAQTTIDLRVGWNLVSFPSINTTYTVADLKAETGATRVEGFDPAPPYFLRVLGDAEVLQAGMGYWVRVEADTIWTVSFA